MLFRSGGICPENLCDYIERKNVFAVGGSWMVKKDLIAREDWDSITKISQEAVLAIQTVRQKK